MVGLLALGAATLGAGWAWIVPLTWMHQPTASTSAIVTALVVGVTGTVTYAVAGPRR
jgi:hypothetical protein